MLYLQYSREAGLNMRPIIMVPVEAKLAIVWIICVFFAEEPQNFSKTRNLESLCDFVYRVVNYQLTWNTV